MERIQLGVQDGSKIRTAFLSYDEDSDGCHVSLEYKGVNMAGEGPDFFEALLVVRQALEKKGLLLSCYGASLNVFPSSMARDMGRGLKAYRLTLGMRGRAQDLVRIFDTGPDVQPATVSAQRDYFDLWLKSF